MRNSRSLLGPPAIYHRKWAWASAIIPIISKSDPTIRRSPLAGSGPRSGCPGRIPPMTPHPPHRISTHLRPRPSSTGMLVAASAIPDLHSTPPPPAPQAGTAGHHRDADPQITHPADCRGTTHHLPPRDNTSHGTPFEATRRQSPIFSYVQPTKAASAPTAHDTPRHQL
jgi:hypothetical protein